MGKIHMPPDPGQHPLHHCDVLSFCIEDENDPLCIEIRSNGWLLAEDDGLFNKPIPPAYYPKETPPKLLGPYKPNPVQPGKDVFQKLAFCDADDHNATYFIEVHITKHCQTPLPRCP